MDRTMESIVQCPYCGKYVPVVMNQYVESVSGLMEFLTNQLGKTDNFQCEGKCTCGATLVASLHVTGLIEE